MAKVKPIPDGFHTVTPYLVVDDAAGTIAFLEKAFDATHHHTPTLRPDGKVMHATLRIGNSHVMIGNSSPMAKAMQTMLYLYVEDVDKVHAQAVAAGGNSVMAPMDMFYGDRSGAVSDAAGNHWWIATKIEEMSPQELQARAQKMFDEQADTRPNAQ